MAIGARPHSNGARKNDEVVGRRGVRIAGVGMYVPEKRLTNHDLEQMVATSDEWIVTRSGIKERRIVADDEGTASMALAAAQGALAKAQVNGDQVDLIIVATVSPDYQFPAVASLVQAALNAPAAAFDLQAGCSGWIYALVTGAQFVANGTYERVLVIGSETLSRLIDWTDRETCVLFGDGAGAALLEATSGPGDFRAIALGSDGATPRTLHLSGIARPLVACTPSNGPAIPALVEESRYIAMDGRQVFRFGTMIATEMVKAVADDAGWSLDDIDLIVPHQANRRIILAASKALEVPMDRFFINLDRYGNTSAGSIPIALYEAEEVGRLQPGTKVVMVAFGAGLAWAAAALEWQCAS